MKIRLFLLPTLLLTAGAILPSEEASSSEPQTKKVRYDHHKSLASYEEGQRFYALQNLCLAKVPELETRPLKDQCLTWMAQNGVAAENIPLSLSTTLNDMETQRSAIARQVCMQNRLFRTSKSKIQPIHARGPQSLVSVGDEKFASITHEQNLEIVSPNGSVTKLGTYPAPANPEFLHKIQVSGDTILVKTEESLKEGQVYAQKLSHPTSDAHKITSEDGDMADIVTPAISPDGNTLALHLKDKKLTRVITLEHDKITGALTHKTKYELPDSSPLITSLAVDNHGKLVVGDLEKLKGRVTFFDPEKIDDDGKIIGKRFSTKRNGWATHSAITPDGRFTIVSYADVAYFIDTTSGEIIGKLKSSSAPEVDKVTFSKDLTFAIVQWGDNKFSYWNLLNNQSVRIKPKIEVSDTALVQDERGDKIVSCGNEGLVSTTALPKPDTEASKLANIMAPLGQNLDLSMQPMARDKKIVPMLDAHLALCQKLGFEEPRWAAFYEQMRDTWATTDEEVYEETQPLNP